MHLYHFRRYNRIYFIYKVLFWLLLKYLRAVTTPFNNKYKGILSLFHYFSSLLSFLSSFWLFLYFAIQCRGLMSQCYYDHLVNLSKMPLSQPYSSEITIQCVSCGFSLSFNHPYSIINPIISEAGGEDNSLRKPVTFNDSLYSAQILPYVIKE